MAKQKQRGTKAKARRTIKPTLYYEIVGLTLFALSIITILQLGVVGKSFVLFFRFFFGEWYIIGVLGVIALSVAFVIKRGWPNLLNKRLIGVYLIVLAILMFSHITLFNLLTKDGAVQNTSVIVSTKDYFFLEMKKGPDSVHLGGGMFGALMFATCYFLFDEVGAYIIGIILVILGILCITNKHIGEVLAPVGRILRSQFQVMQGDYKDWKSQRVAEQTEKKKTTRSKRHERVAEQEEAIEPVEEIEIGPPIISNFTENYPVREETEKQIEENDLITPPFIEEAVPPAPEEQLQKKRGEKIVESLEGETKAPPMQFSNVENKDYKLPSLDILKFPQNKQVTNENAEIYENARKLERTFQSFGVKAKVTKVHIGPAVTKYEVYPDMGVKVSKIVSLSDDIGACFSSERHSY